jgi:hypothetical protein
MLDKIPLNSIKVYAMDRSAFWPFTGELAEKAKELQFEFIQYVVA